MTFDPTSIPKFRVNTDKIRKESKEDCEQNDMRDIANIINKLPKEEIDKMINRSCGKFHGKEIKKTSKKYPGHGPILVGEYMTGTINHTRLHEFYITTHIQPILNTILEDKRQYNNKQEQINRLINDINRAEDSRDDDILERLLEQKDRLEVELDNLSQVLINASNQFQSGWEDKDRMVAAYVFLSCHFIKNEIDEDYPTIDKHIWKFTSELLNTRNYRTPFNKSSTKNQYDAEFTVKWIAGFLGTDAVTRASAAHDYNSDPYYIEELGSVLNNIVNESDLSLESSITSFLDISSAPELNIEVTRISNFGAKGKTYINDNREGIFDPDDNCIIKCNEYVRNNESDHHKMLVNEKDRFEKENIIAIIVTPDYRFVRYEYIIERKKNRKYNYVVYINERNGYYNHMKLITNIRLILKSEEISLIKDYIRKCNHNKEDYTETTYKQCFYCNYKHHCYKCLYEHELTHKDEIDYDNDLTERDNEILSYSIGVLSDYNSYISNRSKWFNDKLPFCRTCRQQHKKSLPCTFKPLPYEYKDVDCWCYDIESFRTEDGVQIPVLLGLGKLNDDRVLIFYGENCIEEFIGFLNQSPGKIEDEWHEFAKKPYGYYYNGINTEEHPKTKIKYVYAHNGAAYDNFLTFMKCMDTKFNIRITKPILDGLKVISIQIGKIILRDSMLHMPGSIKDWAKELNLYIMKGEIDHSKNIFGKTEIIDDELSKYLANDVLILKNMLEFYKNTFKEIYNFNPLRFITLSTAVKELYLVRYYKSSFNMQYTDSTPAVQNMLSKVFRGGYTGVIKRRSNLLYEDGKNYKIGNGTSFLRDSVPNVIVSYDSSKPNHNKWSVIGTADNIINHENVLLIADVKSHYPNILRGKVAIGHKIIDNEIVRYKYIAKDQVNNLINSNEEFICRANISFANCRHSLISPITGYKDEVPIETLEDGWYDVLSYELRDAIKIGAVCLEMETIYILEVGTPFAEFMNEGLRHKEKHNDNKALRKFFKNIINIPWGKFGQRTEDSSILILKYAEDYDVFFNKIIEEGFTGYNNEITQIAYVKLSNKRTKKQFCTSTCLPLAVSTTAIGRSMLFNAMEPMQEYIMMFDTDSIAACIPRDRLDSFNIKMKASIGEFQNEYPNGIIDIVAIAPKAYCVVYINDKNEVDFKSTCKVFGKNLQYDDYVNISNGNVIVKDKLMLQRIENTLIMRVVGYVIGISSSRRVIVDDKTYPYGHIELELE